MEAISLYKHSALKPIYKKPSLLSRLGSGLTRTVATPTMGLGGAVLGGVGGAALGGLGLAAYSLATDKDNQSMWEGLMNAGKKGLPGAMIGGGLGAVGGGVGGGYMGWRMGDQSPPQIDRLEEEDEDMPNKQSGLLSALNKQGNAQYGYDAQGNSLAPQPSMGAGLAGIPSMMPSAGPMPSMPGTSMSAGSMGMPSAGMGMGQGMGLGAGEGGMDMGAGDSLNSAMADSSGIGGTSGQAVDKAAGYRRLVKQAIHSLLSKRKG